VRVSAVRTVYEFWLDLHEASGDEPDKTLSERSNMGKGRDKKKNKQKKVVQKKKVARKPKVTDAPVQAQPEMILINRDQL
jgi:hypothetical protein